MSKTINYKKKTMAKQIIETGISKMERFKKNGEKKKSYNLCYQVACRKKTAKTIKSKNSKK